MEYIVGMTFQTAENMRRNGHHRQTVSHLANTCFLPLAAAPLLSSLLWFVVVVVACHSSIEDVSSGYLETNGPYTT